MVIDSTNINKTTNHLLSYMQQNNQSPLILHAFVGKFGRWGR